MYDGKSSQTRFACNHTMELSKKAALDTASSICLYYNRISKIPMTAAQTEKSVRASAMGRVNLLVDAVGQLVGTRPTRAHSRGCQVTPGKTPANNIARSSQSNNQKLKACAFVLFCDVFARKNALFKEKNEQS